MYKEIKIFCEMNVFQIIIQIQVSCTENLMNYDLILVTIAFKIR